MITENEFWYVFYTSITLLTLLIN